MKKHLASLSILSSVALLGSLAQADTIGGVARADFATNELSIPCVQLKNFDGKNNDMFFDVVLVRRGKSFNYELSLAEPEDATFCQRLADFANFEDDDLEDDGSEDGESAPRLLAQCEVSEDRSRVSVSARNLDAGEYAASITSGGSTVESASATADEDEVEFDFDSNPDDVLAGATEIAADFIQDDEVTAELMTVDGEVLLSATVSCEVK